MNHAVDIHHPLTNAELAAAIGRGKARLTTSALLM